VDLTLDNFNQLLYGVENSDPDELLDQEPKEKNGKGLKAAKGKVDRTGYDWAALRKRLLGY